MIPEKDYWRLWCSAMLRIAEERRDYLKLEMLDTDSENLNGQYMALDLLVLRLAAVFAEADKGAIAYGRALGTGGDA